jgi:hypothetical protein
MEIKEKTHELEKQNEELKKESKKEEMEEWFKSLLNGLEIRIRNNHPNTVYYKKNGKVFFQLYQDLKIKHLWVDSDLVWIVFKIKYDLNYNEIQSFIKSMVKKYLKLSKVTPRCAYDASVYRE